MGPELRDTPTPWDILLTAIQLIAPTQALDGARARAAWVQMERWMAAWDGPEHRYQDGLRLLLDPSPWEDVHRELVCEVLLRVVQAVWEQGTGHRGDPGGV